MLKMSKFRRGIGVLWIIAFIVGLRGAGTLFDVFGKNPSGAPNDGVSLQVDTLNELESISSNGYGFDLHARVPSRHLLSMPNCTPRAVEQFPRDLFTQSQRKGGAIVLHVLIVAYMFLALAIVCDVYFVPSLEVLCDLMNLQTDVAGATFMAAGSSAPELATSVIGVFVAKDDVGLSAVVGSAIYNVMFVISVCGFAAGTSVPLSWWPITRDCVAYLVSIGALIFVIYDEIVMWYESLLFLVLYVIYIIFMFYNKRLETKALASCLCCPQQSKTQSDQLVVHYEKISTENEPPSKMNGETTPINPKQSVTNNGSTASMGGEDGVSLVKNGRRPSLDSVDYSEEMTATEVHQIDESEAESVWDYPSDAMSRLLWIISIPLYAVMFITMPDCRKKRFRRWFWLTFLISLIWLSLYSFLMVWMITIIGFTVNIPDSVMSLTFVAFGVSLPDVVASVLVIREGLGDMAVSNAVGSNVFDILVCLGTPWFIKTCIIKPGSHIQVYSQGLVYSSFTLLSTVFLLLLGVHLNRWKLDKKLSVLLMLVYLAFTLLASLYELNVFGYFHPKECPSNY